MPRRKKITTKPISLPPAQPATAKARLWLWIGVSAFTTIIVVLWGWAASIRLASFSWDKTPEKKLVEKSQNDWNTLFNNEKTRLNNEQVKLQIKNVIDAIVAESNSTTISTSTISANSTNSTTVSSTQ